MNLICEDQGEIIKNAVDFSNLISDVIENDFDKNE